MGTFKSLWMKSTQIDSGRKLRKIKCTTFVHWLFCTITLLYTYTTLVFWYTLWYIGTHFGILVLWYIVALVFWYFGTFVLVISGIFGVWCFGTSILFGTLVSTLVLVLSGILILWYFGTFRYFWTFFVFLVFRYFLALWTLIKKGQKLRQFGSSGPKLTLWVWYPRYLDLSVMRITSARDLSLLQRDYRFNVKLALIAASGVHTVSPAGGPRPYS